MSILKGIGYFLGFVALFGIVSLIYSAVVNSSVWDLVPDGFAKSFMVLLPLGFVLAGLGIAIWKGMGKDKERRG